jgi:hypothetical protein
MSKTFLFQKLKVLQRKLEEHEEALLGRAQVVDLLQQELTTAEQRNQVLPVIFPAYQGSIYFHFSFVKTKIKTKGTSKYV